MQVHKKKRPFENSWSITYRKQNYDALGDPHASYYFLNKSMHKHLKSLKKSIQRQGSFTQRKKIRYMIEQRIKDYDERNETTKVQPYFYNMKSSSSISSLNSFRTRQILNEEKAQEKKDKQKVKQEQTITKQSKTLDVKTVYKQQKQKKVLDASKQRRVFELPKITFLNKKQQKQKDKKSIEKQITKQQKQQKKLNTLNKTQHNKFLKFIVEHKKKLQSHSTKKQKNFNQQTKSIQPKLI